MKTNRTSELLREQALAWLLRSNSENFSPEEREGLQQWLAQSPEHRRAYLQAEAHWQWLEQFKSVPFPARDAALRYRRKSLGTRRIYSMAAMLLLALGLSAVSSDGWLGLPRTYRTSIGDRQTVQLADGSRLELNTGSEVQVHYNRWRRQVELLRGEAFFTVKHDSERPFEVSAGQLRIRDMGTEFNVYKLPDRVNVSVSEGRVEIDGGGERHGLSAGQQIACSDKGLFIPLEGQDIASATAWRQGMLIFKGRRLDEALRELGRYHDIRIRMTDRSLAGMRVNGSFRTGQLDHMLKAVTTLLPVKIKRAGAKDIVLEAAG